MSPPDGICLKKILEGSSYLEKKRLSISNLKYYFLILNFHPLHILERTALQQIFRNNLDSNFSKDTNGKTCIKIVLKD